MADEKSDGLGEADKESSSFDELFSGSLEPLEDDKEAGKEPPQAEAPKKAESDGTSAFAGESEDSDPELKGIFDDLEKDIPEALKNSAGNVKKKLQGYFTKKNQTISKELETLKANQITDDLKRDYITLYGWYNKIQQNPQAGLKELASQFGVSVEALVKASEAALQPKTEELTPDKLETAEDYANFVRQETRKAIEEIREKEVKPLKETLSKFAGTSAQRENIQRGQHAVQEAIATLPGFANDDNGKKAISKEGQAAIAAVLNGEFVGPNALRNAYKSIIADSYISKAKESEDKVKETETKILELKRNVAGASNPPGHTKTNTIAPSSPETFWQDLREESLS